MMRYTDVHVIPVLFLAEEVLLFPDFFFQHEIHSAGKRDLHFTECSEEFVRAETAQTAAAGGGQRIRRLHGYGDVSLCV